MDSGSPTRQRPTRPCGACPPLLDLPPARGRATSSAVHLRGPSPSSGLPACNRRPYNTHGEPEAEGALVGAELQRWRAAQCGPPSCRWTSLTRWPATQTRRPPRRRARRARGTPSAAGTPPPRAAAWWLPASGGEPELLAGRTPSESPPHRSPPTLNRYTPVSGLPTVEDCSAWSCTAVPRSRVALGRVAALARAPSSGPVLRGHSLTTRGLAGHCDVSPGRPYGPPHGGADRVGTTDDQPKRRARKS